MRVYLAGPMSGIEGLNYPAFEAAANNLRANGYWVASPHEFFPPDPKLTREECLKVDLKHLLDCDAIAMLPGWENSVGANAELSVAKMVGLGLLEYSKSWCLLPLTEPPKPTETILEEAQRLVHGNRGADYGHPIHDYARTGRIWGAILGIPDIDPRICCLMMAGVKVSREVNKHKRDNLTDLAGYAECASMVAEYKEEF